jgi:hypothetical protein
MGIVLYKMVGFSEDERFCGQDEWTDVVYAGAIAQDFRTAAGAG